MTDPVSVAFTIVVGLATMLALLAIAAVFVGVVEILYRLTGRWFEDRFQLVEVLVYILLTLMFAYLLGEITLSSHDIDPSAVIGVSS